MSEIIQLPENVANQISAGEVVERPASVVKELVENSIDAGADRIFIDVKDGGKTWIRVKDNGSGIHGKELELAFSRYATSKIKEINDLYSLRTLGFRGEALASIASVARMEVFSKQKESKIGYQLNIEGGQYISKEVVGCPQGTEIIVRDLFFNTPARYKYLKTNSTEFGHISKIISREALAYPEINFRLVHNGQTVINTPGTGKLKDTIYKIYDKELIDNLIEIDVEDRYIKLTGYLVNPNLNRSNRTHLHFFVNQRSVYNNYLLKAVETGYQGLLPPGRHPLVFLFIKLNPILVDINVHPTKREIKFSRNKIISDVISKSIRSIIKKDKPAPEYKTKSKEKSNPIRKNFNFNNINKSNYGQNSNYINKEYTEENSQNKQYIVNHNYKQEQTDNLVAEEYSFNFLGQIMNSYLVIEYEGELNVIDQHNAHERVLFDQLAKNYDQNENNRQALLMPLKLELTPEEKELVLFYQDELLNMGIMFDDFGGNTILIQEIPHFLKNKSTRNIIEEFISDLLEDGKISNKSKIKERMLKYLSCRTAIKAGKILHRKESLNLIKQLLKTENPFRCPHGRPIMIKLTQSEIEKGLGRR